MRLIQYFCLIIALLYSGCVCMFVPCDRRLHVSGHVYDAQRKPISRATVEFHGVEKQTDENGCFYFGGHSALPDLNVSVTKSEYKSYIESKEFGFYDIDVILVPDNIGQPSSGVWRKLQMDEISKYKDCSER